MAEDKRKGSNTVTESISSVSFLLKGLVIKAFVSSSILTSQTCIICQDEACELVALKIVKYNRLHIYIANSNEKN